MRIILLLYVIILGLVVNLLANMIWKYLPGTDRHLDKILTGVLVAVCLLLLVYHKPHQDTLSGQAALLQDKPQQDTRIAVGPIHAREGSVHLEVVGRDKRTQDNPTPAAQPAHAPAMPPQALAPTSHDIRVDGATSENGDVSVEVIGGDKVTIHQDHPEPRSDTPPLISPVDVEIPYGYRLEGASTAGRTFSVYAQPISVAPGRPNPPAQDIILTFDVTNPCPHQMKIAAIYVDVLAYHQLLHSTTTPLPSAGETRRYFCAVAPRPGRYEARPIRGHWDYIKLSKGELENFGVHVNTTTPGVYELRVNLRYSVDGKAHDTTLAGPPQVVAFF